MHAQYQLAVAAPGGMRHGARRGMAFLLDDVLSIEASLILFVFAGRIKALPELQFIPFDLTLFFFALTLGLTVWGCVSRRLKPMPLDVPTILMLAFVGYAVVSLYWSSLDPRNIDKAWRTVLVGVSTYFFAVTLAQDKERRARLVRLVIAFSCAILVYYAYHRWIVGIDERALAFTGRVQGNNYIEYGSHASYLFYGCLAIALFGPRGRLVFALGGAVAAMFALLTMGGRGPLVFSGLAVVLAIGGLMLCPPKFATGLRRLLILAAVLVGLGWGGIMALVAVKGPAAVEEQFYTLQRMELQLSGENTHSLDVREEARELAWRRWLERPLFGWGLGEFRIHHSLEWPHNLSLEVLMEMGLVGACLFFPVQLLGVFACVRVARNRDSDWVDAAIVLLFLTDFISHTTFQGYLPNDRIYFAYLGMIIALHGAMRSQRAAAAVTVAAPAMASPQGAGTR